MITVEESVTPILIKRKDAARYIGVSERSVDRAIRAGLLRAIRHGNRVMVPRADLETFGFSGRASRNAADVSRPEVDTQ